MTGWGWVILSFVPMLACEAVYWWWRARTCRLRAERAEAQARAFQAAAESYRLTAMLALGMPGISTGHELENMPVQGRA